MPSFSRLLAGENPEDSLPTEDVEYVADLGLIETWPQLCISNRIYQEVIPRELMQRVVLELKLLHKGLEETIAEGLKQTAASADQCGAEETHLILFDRRLDRSWEEKIWHRTEQIGQRTIGVWGM